MGGVEHVAVALFERDPEGHVLKLKDAEGDGEVGEAVRRREDHVGTNEDCCTNRLLDLLTFECASEDELAGGRVDVGADVFPVDDPVLGGPLDALRKGRWDDSEAEQDGQQGESKGSRGSVHGDSGVADRKAAGRFVTGERACPEVRAELWEGG